ncbi:MAG: Maf family nucleotide pyrophosphatase [Hyphomonadaceae bacterium]|nr:Maf family nucleotide pyrophosphatase [Hyphomonadaceae bacterium]
MRLVLASASPRRRALLAQIGVTPHAVEAPDVEETPLPGEQPGACAARLAQRKAESLSREGALVLAADTVVAVGRRITPKAEDECTARACLSLLSGRNHRVFTGLALAGPFGVRTRLVETRVRFKRLSEAEIAWYLAAGEWRGKAGGYAIQGLAGRFVTALHGSYTAVVGLPLYETAALLEGAGWPLRAGGGEDGAGR